VKDQPQDRLRRVGISVRVTAEKNESRELVVLEWLLKRGREAREKRAKEAA
jgi:hypothetical protein